MYAPGPGRKWCLMNVLMYLWFFVLGLCVLLCGQGAGVVAMHLTHHAAPPPPPPSNFLVVLGHSQPWSWRTSKSSSSSLKGANEETSSPISNRRRPTRARESAVPHHLFSRSSSNLNASDLDKQLENVWYRIWTRRRPLEALRRMRRRRQHHQQTQHHNLAESVQVHDTRPEDSPKENEGPSVRTKRDSRFGGYPTRMFQPSPQGSSGSLSSGQAQGPMHLHPKFYPPSPPVPAAVASPSLTSARQRLGFEQQQQPQHLSRQSASAGFSSGGPHESPSSHNTMFIKPKEQHGPLQGSAGVPIPQHSSPAMGSTGIRHHSSSSNNNIHQHNTHNNHTSHLRGGHKQGTGAGHKGGGGGGLLQPKERRYCSARDPANLAFEAGVVFEGRVRSMSTHNYSVTFQVLKVHKTQPGFAQIPSHIRIHFKQVKNRECDLHRDSFRNPAHIRGKLEQGKVYFIFGKFVEMNNFTLIGQPMRSTIRHQGDVRNGLSDTYGQSASIEKLLVKGKPNKPVKLTCKVNGQPPPTVTWYKGNQMITKNRAKYKFRHRKRQSLLIIRTYDLSDSGVYECRAKNRLTKQLANATIRVDFSHYLSGPAASSPTRSPSPPHSESGRPSGSGSDEKKPQIFAKECPPEQKERYCMNGGKCVYFPEVSEVSCSCPDGFDGERCDMKIPTTYNHSSMYSTNCEHNTYLGGYYC